ncbi:unnamed protein product [Phyllotreta striolata]|uniref:Peptidase S1 domain-containing protein n=1 Tax=Phyllotreta striolata TaxID=444603 RepID=A0A9N9TWI0_PHYSR|nr:unnamed protein product [Phyllotreta striolata]
MVKFERSFNIFVVLVFTLGLLEEVPAEETTKVPGDKAREMCKQYSQYAYEPLGSTKLKCLIKPESYITNKTVASEGEFPHTIQLGYINNDKTTWICGGILLSPTFIATTGHCIPTGSRIGYGTLKFARGGLTDIDETKHEQIRNITRTFLHPSINKKYNDIALVEVDRPFDLNPYLRPACLYTQHNIPEKTTLSTSWGRKWLGLDDGFDDKKLLKVTLDIFSNAECNKVYQPLVKHSDLDKGIDEASMICAGTRTDRNSCIGISGYPLMLVHPDTESVKCMYDVIGITSFGIPCTSNDTNKPSVYMRISNYIGWIEKLVWSN